MTAHNHTRDGLLAGTRIVVVDAGLVGGYAGRLFADQGAEVVHVEPADGTELSRRAAEAGSPPGALYRHLTAGTRRLRVDAGPRSLEPVETLVRACDAVVLDTIGGGDRPALTPDQVRPWCAGAVMAVVSLWGADRTDPARAGTEFTLQAVVGGTGSRGQRDAPPLSADGDRGFWHTGAYTAVALLSALGAAPADRPTELDIAALECMVTAWNLFEWIRRDLWDPPRDLERWTDVPGIERAKDGWVGFSLVTPPQWTAYCHMTEAPQLLADPAFRQMTGRCNSADAIRAATEPWLTRHTVAEIVAIAGRRRIPAVPVVPAGRLPDIDHFQQRGTFLPAVADLPVRPAPPFRIDGVRRATTTPLADDGDSGDQVWSARVAPPAALDLTGVGVLDVTAFYAGPHATQLLAMLGADVVHVESAQAYDGMRNVTTRPRSETGWWEFSYVYQGAQAGKRSLALDLSHPQSAQALDALLTEYDVVVENFSRDVAPRLGLVHDELTARNPGVVFLRSPGFGLDGPWSDMRAFAMTGDQISGLAWRTGWENGRPTAPRTIGDSFTAVHSAFALLAALRQRAATGRGAFIEMSSMEASISLAAEEVVEWTANGIDMGRHGNRCARVAPRGVYATAGNDEWIAVSVETDDAWRGLLGAIDALAEQDGAQAWTVSQRLEQHDEIDTWISSWTADRTAAVAVDTLQSHGVPAEVVARASDLSNNDRLRKRGYFSRFVHPLAGVLDYGALPWLRDGERPRPHGPAPLFGNDTEAVLADAGMTARDVASLLDAGAAGGLPPVEPRPASPA